jgi:uncharacterized protein YdeI (YjbR/CyaY-like superfamily)
MRKHTGKGGITWAEAVDQALCFGWIDSVRKRVDEDRYTNRFTPRKPRSTWSATNCQRVEELTELGLMRPSGLAAYQARDQARTQQYSYEAADRLLSDDFQTRLRANPVAWTFFQAQTLSYRKAASWWVMSAKKEETRTKRLTTLIEDSGRRQRVAHLRTGAKSEAEPPPEAG